MADEDQPPVDVETLQQQLAAFAVEQFLISAASTLASLAFAKLERDDLRTHAGLPPNPRRHRALDDALDLTHFLALLLDGGFVAPVAASFTLVPPPSTERTWHASAGAGAAVLSGVMPRTSLGPSNPSPGGSRRRGRHSRRCDVP